MMWSVVVASRGSRTWPLSDDDEVIVTDDADLAICTLASIMASQVRLLKIGGQHLASRLLASQVRLLMATDVSEVISEGGHDVITDVTWYSMERLHDG
jgi:hypothetical protein